MKPNGIDRERRRAELKMLNRKGRSALLALYQQGGDLDQLAKRPRGVTFAAMIAAILDRKERQSGRC